MSTTFTALSADDIDALVQGLLDVLGVTDHLSELIRTACDRAIGSETVTHVHDKDAGLVKLVDHFFGRDTDGAHEQLGLFLDNDIDQVVQLALGVIVVGLSRIRSEGRDEEIDPESCEGSAMPLLTAGSPK